MNPPGFDRDRMLLYAVLLSALVGIVLYATVYLTLAVYGPLNERGMLLGRVALFVTVGTLGLALVLALTARSASLSSAALSGSGWFLVFGGIALLFPAWGVSAAAVRGLSAFGGYAGAIFLVLAGGLVLQAEHAARDRQGTPGAS
ncbi:MAG TPA: hypothetical protein VJG32_07685 [Anaerolineae bacterium]|nr:hypothetical protein [Anaerolineae bacterium]